MAVENEEKKHFDTHIVLFPTPQQHIPYGLFLVFYGKHQSQSNNTYITHTFFFLKGDENKHQRPGWEPEGSV